jgi:hypothetical protein
MFSARHVKAPLPVNRLQKYGFCPKKTKNICFIGKIV